jgi:hypothetical protein
VRTIWKFPVAVTDDPVIRMPAGAQLLRFDLQDDVPTLWALVDDSSPVEDRTFRLAGTGHPLDELRRNARYIGTVLMSAGLVLHLFENPQARKRR